MIRKYAILQLVVASCFIVLSIFDHWFFIFHPFQVAIVVDLEEKTDQERALLRKLQIESELHSTEVGLGAGNNYLSSPTNSKVQGRKQNCYLRVFMIAEFMLPLLVAVI